MCQGMSYFIMRMRLLVSVLRAIHAHLLTYLNLFPRRSSSPIFLAKKLHRQVHSMLCNAILGCTSLVMASRTASEQPYR
ncbi:hypothetical protein CY34DRAFT_463771 [Suillus luteus UH-Slu-Lm8-n1]|uniref:Uncharacterized protein n=1 Tax=Suillus luteus UH-Slu-Lm8-n1 TaxID=930992 RepID=A0A0D0A7G8_9AGAM|nr:hypothetical protein CY34DRAFT_463771 [Suillus luteus UH-Slu-Lm8-n1]